jgi:hypothetical protein
MFSEDVLQAALKLIDNLSTDPIRAFGNVFETSEKSKPFTLYRFWETTCLQKQEI